jgi:hypothetical protein
LGFENGSQIVQGGVVRYYRDFWPEFGDLAGQQFDVSTGYQGVDSESIGPPANHVEGAGSNGSGRSQKRQESHSTPIITSGRSLTAWVFFGEFLFERGAGKVASGVFNEVSLALVGVSLPGLIPILVYF